MRRAACILLALLCASRVAAIDSTVHRPLAVVDTELITFSDVESRAAAALRGLADVYRGKELMRRRGEVIEKALDQLIEEKLLVLEGRRLAKQFPSMQQWVDEQIERLVRQQTQREGAEVRFDKDLRATMEDYVILSFVTERFIRQGVSAGPAEVRAYYDRHPKEFSLPKRVSYRQIVVLNDDFETEAAAMERAGWIRRNLAPDGRDFAQFAIKHSAGPRAKEGGLWKAGEWSTEDKTLREAVLTLKAGEISSPVKGTGVHVLFFAERVLPASKLTFREAHETIRKRILAEKEASSRQKLIEKLYERFNVRRVE